MKIEYLWWFMVGMLIGVIIGMFRMSLYFHKKKPVDNYLEFSEDELESDR